MWFGRTVTGMPRSRAASAKRTSLGSSPLSRGRRHPLADRRVDVGQPTGRRCSPQFDQPQSKPQSVAEHPFALPGMASISRPPATPSTRPRQTASRAQRCSATVRATIHCPSRVSGQASSSAGSSRNTVGQSDSVTRTTAALDQAGRTGMTWANCTCVEARPPDRPSPRPACPSPAEHSGRSQLLLDARSRTVSTSVTLPTPGPKAAGADETTGRADSATSTPPS